MNFMPDDLLDPQPAGAAATVSASRIGPIAPPTTTAPRAQVVLVYNDADHLEWPPEFTRDAGVVTWQNCGNEKEALKLPTECGRGVSMLDRENYEWNRRLRAGEWLVLAEKAIGKNTGPLIAYDPMGWDPMKLRRTPWSSMPLSDFAKHMRSRRELLPYLMDYRLIATDCYPPRGYDLTGYLEWADLKLQAHDRVVREAGKIPMCLLRLDPEGGADGLALQAELVKHARNVLGLKLMVWGLWGWSNDSQTLANHVAAAWMMRDLLVQKGVRL